MKPSIRLILLVSICFALVAHGQVGDDKWRIVQAQMGDAYTPTGILVSELPDEVPPGRLNIRFPQRNPTDVEIKIRHDLAVAAATVGQEVAATPVVPTITPEISTLAAGLENNPLAIYDYVYNHIDYIPSWGLLKNPRETLLAGVGNAFDQAALLSALLNAAGFSTRYVWGEIRISKTAAMNWVGAADPSIVGNIFASGGIPTASIGDNLQLDHIWLEVLDNNVWRALDPSFKNYHQKAKQDLPLLLGLDLAAFTNRILSGATATADFVQNLKQSTARGDLTEYARKLLTHLREHDPFIELSTLIGGRQIVKITSTAYPNVLPYQIVQSFEPATTIPTQFAYQLRFQLPGINYTVRVDEIAGERITLFYECATPADCERLQSGGGIYQVQPAYLVNVTPKLRIGGVIQATGAAVALGSQDQQFTVTLIAPFGEVFSSTQILTAGEWYAFPMRLQTVSSRALNRQHMLLVEAIAQGLNQDDEPILGQLLNLLGLAYFNEVAMGDQIDSRLAEIVHVPHFSLLIASRGLLVWVDPSDPAQRSVALDPASHSVDVRLGVDTVLSAQNPANANRERAWFLSAGMRGSATEHAILEQLQPLEAISTVQILNRASETGQPIYYITPDNVNNVLSQLNNHHPLIVNAIRQTVLNKQHVVISQSPITYNQWVGSGWIALDPISGSASYIIAGGIGINRGGVLRQMNGGGGTREQAPSETLLIGEKVRGGVETRGRREASGNDSQSATLAAMSRNLSSRPEQESVRNGISHFVMDPIDVTTGNFVYDQIDLNALGGRGLPLTVERFYAASAHAHRSPLGFGWSHTYNEHFALGTHWLRGFGSRQALEATAAVVAAQIGLALFETTTVPKEHFPMDVIVTQWLMTQMTGNAAILVEPNGIVTSHLRLSDGTYEPLAGSERLDTLTLTTDGQATLVWKNGEQAHYDLVGRLTRRQDAHGNATLLTYNEQGLLSQASDAVGRTLILTYDTQNRLSQVTDPAQRTFRYTYDNQGNLATYTDPGGHVTTYTYDANHRMITITDPMGVVFVTNQYDALGRVAIQTNGRSQQVRLLYGGDRTILVDALNQRTTYRYDERNRLIAIDNALGHRQSAAYDAADHLLSFTNGLGETITFVYNNQGHLASITDPLGHTKSWRYDAAQNPISFSDRRGNLWQFTHDNQHNLTSITDPLGGVTTYTHNPQGQVITGRDATGLTVSYSYDGQGNLQCTTNHDQSSCWSYDELGRPITFADGDKRTTQFTYNAAGRLSQMTNALGQQTNYTYDGNGNLVGVTDANGHTTTYVYDPQFNVTQVTDASGGITGYVYDANDKLVKVVDANGHATSYGRNPLGQLTTITDPLGRTVVFGYDAAGRRVDVRRADGAHIQYLRDPLGRLTTVNYPNRPDLTFTYDAMGNLTSTTPGSSRHTTNDATVSQSGELRTYDADGRLIGIEDVARNLRLTYAYDLAGRRTGLTVSRGATVLYNLTYTYNAAGQLATVEDRTTDPITTMGFGYDRAGRIVSITQPSGANTAYSYDPVGHPLRVQHTNSQAQLLAADNYTYDAVGNITANTASTPVGDFVTSYQYDALDRLTQEKTAGHTIAYLFDAVGNLTQRTDALGVINYSYDAANQLQSSGDDQFTYDVHGNPATWQSVDGTYVFSYDDENLLTNLTLPNGTVLRFAYDAFGRRTEAQGPNTTRGFLYDGFDILAEGDGTLAQIEERYLHGNGLLLGRQTPSWGFTAYHGDALANVRYLLDNAGQPIASYRYEAFGRTVQSAGVDPNPYRFLGQQNVRQPGIPAWPVLLTTYREYSFQASRFLTRDPLPGNLLHPLTLNDYSYALNNPLRYYDPVGLRPVVLAPSPNSPGNTTIGAAEGNDRVSLVEEATRRDEPPLAEILALFFEVKSATRSDELNTYTAKEEAMRWTPVFFNSGVYALTCTNDNKLLAGAFHNGLFQSDDATHALWNSTYAAADISVISASANAYYAGTWTKGILRYRAGNATWQISNNGLGANAVYALVNNPKSGQLFVGTEMGLFTSNDGGASWQRPAGALPGRTVSALALVNDVLLASTEKGFYRSTDAGASWQRSSNNLPPVQMNTVWVNAMTHTVYVGTATGAYQSSDQGINWAPLGGGLAGRNVHAFAVDPANANHLVVGTSGGLFRSLDGGATWLTDAIPGLDNSASQIGAIAFCRSGGDENLYLGTGRGVYALRAPTPPITVTLQGPHAAPTGAAIIFTATVEPPTTTLPITYTWQATDQPTVVRTGGRQTVVSFSWRTPNTKTITVIVTNGIGQPLSTTHTLMVIEYKIYLPTIRQQARHLLFQPVVWRKD